MKATGSSELLPGSSSTSKLHLEVGMYSQPSLLLAANPKMTETDWPDLVGYPGLWVTPSIL